MRWWVAVYCVTTRYRAGRSAIDGRQRPVASATITITSLAGHLPPFRTINIARFKAMLDSRVEPSVPSRESPLPLWICELREGE